MSYQKQEFKNGNKLEAYHLNHMEDGITRFDGKGEESINVGLPIPKLGAVYATDNSGKVYVSSKDCFAAKLWPATKRSDGSYYEVIVGHPGEGYVETFMGDFVDPKDLRATEAIGTGSVATGLGAIAYSRCSHSLGHRTQTGYPPSEEFTDSRSESGVLNDQSALPYKTENEGQAATALGSDTKALGKNSIAGGYRTEAIGNNSLALGNGSKATKDSSFALGSGVIASGAGSTAFGGMQEDIATEASGNSAFATGRGTLASGVASHTQGILTQATAAAAHAEGRGSKATEDSAHAEGRETEATGYYSHAEGNFTKSQKHSSHAEGFKTEAIADYAHSEGSYTIAKGIASHVEGHSTIAAGQYQHVQGKYNIEDTEGTYAHIIGNGSGGNARSNAHTVDWEGNAWFAGDVVGGSHKLSEKANTAYVSSNFVTHQDMTAGKYSPSSGSTNSLATKTYVDTSYTIAGQLAGTTLGARATAEGISVTASGAHSHAEGSGSKSTGSQAHAEGYSTQATAQATHTEGAYAKATARFAHAEGYYSEARGEQSHAEGYYTIANQKSQHVQGKYNIVDSDNRYAHIIGNGTGIDTTLLAYHEINFSHAVNDIFMSDTSLRAKIIPGQTYTVEFDGMRYICTASSCFDSNNDANVNILGNMSLLKKLSDIESIPDTDSGEPFFIYDTYIGILGSIPEDAPEGTELSSLQFIHSVGVIQDSRSNAFTVSWDGTASAAKHGTLGEDYAEYFEWVDGNSEGEDRIGFVVSLEGEKIKLASSGDDVLGIVSGTAGVVGGTAEWEWSRKYLHDDFGRVITEKIELFETTITDLDDPEEVKVSIGFHEVPVINPDYDESQQYVRREDRPEWSVIGMFGKLYVRDDGTCQINGYACVGGDGILTASQEKTNMRVLSRRADNIIRVLLK